MRRSVASYINASAYSSFNPIDELNRTDADVTLWVLRNRAIYTGQVHDPFFKATTPWSIGTLQFYKPDSTVGVLACTEQYSFCNGADCTPLNPLMPMTRDKVQELLHYNEAQLATFDLVWRFIWSMRMFFQALTLQEDSLLGDGQSFASSRFSVNLPDNQWQLEVQNSFNVSLALLQQAGLVYVSPPDLHVTLNDTYDNHIFAPTTTEGKKLCSSQKILSSGQYSFNFVALMLIFIGGSVIIVLSHAVPYIVERWQAKSKDKSAQYRKREWDANDVLQLQSILLEERQIESWKVNGGVPVPMGQTSKFALPWLLEAIESDKKSIASDDSVYEQEADVLVK